MNQLRRAGRIALAACAGLFLHLHPEVSGQDSLVDLDSFRTGCQSLEDGRYASAVQSFLAAWEHLDASEAGDLERDFVASRLLEARVRNGETEAAVQWLEEHPPISPSAGTLRWSAFAFEEEKQYAKAAQAYGELSTISGELSRDLRIHQAVCLTLSQRPGIALEIISGLGVPQTPPEALQFAQIAHAAGDPDTAVTFLTTPAEDGGTPLLIEEERAVHFAGIGLRIAILRELGRRTMDTSDIESLIEDSPSEVEAHRAFLLLENALKGDDISRLTKIAEQWVAKEGHPARMAAQFFTVLFTTDPDQREEALRQWKEKHPDSTTAMEASLRLEEPLQSDPAMLPSLPGAKDRLAFEASMTSYRGERFREAAEKFLSNVTQAKGEDRSRNRFNAATAMLKENDFDTFLEIFQGLQQEVPDSPFVADLNYMAGLYLASQGDPRSTDFLQPFVRENPNHPDQIAALLALAEIHLNQAPARPQAASEIFDGLRTRPLTLEQSERLDYTAVWLEIIQHNSVGVVASANEFRKNWPNSDYLPEITMLLAQQHLQDNRPVKALELLDEVAGKFADSPFSDEAVFLAAKSSPSGSEAISRWVEIASSDGEYALEARHELALLYLSLDRFGEARNELEKVNEAAPVDSALSFAARADHAFSFYAEALAKGHDKELLETSAAEFAELSNLADAPDAVRYSSAVRRGRCLEAMNNDAVALEIYESIVSKTESGTLSPIQETDRKTIEWIFRAGFSAIELLSKNESWKEAIKLADALSKKDGPRAIEASQMAEQMRLKHWVWE